jgi:hypothetical protein
MVNQRMKDLAQNQDEIVRQIKFGIRIAGTIVGIILIALGMLLICTNYFSDFIIIMFGLFLSIVGICMICGSFLYVSWLVSEGRLTLRRRILVFGWNSSFSEVNHLEIVHGIWENKEGKIGSTDRLQFWIDGKKKPVFISEQDNSYVPYAIPVVWSLKRQGLPLSPLRRLNFHKMPPVLQATIVYTDLLELGVFLEKKTQRPLLFSDKVIRAPDREPIE